MIRKIFILLLAIGGILFGSCGFDPHSSDKLVDGEKSSFYYVSTDNTIIYKYKQSITGIPLGWSRTKLDADAESFVVLSERYAKDKNSAFYQKNKFQADTKSFAYVNRNYCKDKSSVYYAGRKITNADASTFDIRDGYARDKNSVFLDRTTSGDDSILETIQDADPATYIKLSSKWSKDDFHYFFYNEKTDIDVNTFRMLTDNVILDKESIYYFAGKPSYGHGRSKKYEGEVRKLAKNVWYDDKTIYNFYKMPASFIPVKNPASIHLVDTTKNLVFFVDNLLYWNMSERDASNIDIPTFKCDGSYATDRDRVYYNGMEIKGADKETFQKIDSSFSRDKNNVYYLWEVFSDADPTTFRYVRVEKGQNYYEDKNHRWKYDSKAKTWRIVE